MKNLLDIPFRRLALLGLAVVILAAERCPRRDPSVAPAVYALALNDLSHIQTFNPSFIPLTVRNATNGQYVGPQMMFHLANRLNFGSVPELLIAGTNNDVKVVEIKTDVTTADVIGSIPVGGPVTYVGRCGRCSFGGNSWYLMAVIASQAKVVAIEPDTGFVKASFTLPATSVPLKAIGNDKQLYVISGDPDPALYVFSIPTTTSLSDTITPGDLIAKFRLDPGVADIVLDPISLDLYVSNTAANLIYAIETATYTVKKRINIQSPYALGVSKEALFVTGLSQLGNGRLTKFTLRDQRQLQTVETGAMPKHLTVDIERQLLYVSNHNSPFLTQVTHGMVKLDNVPLPFASAGATAVDNFYGQ